MVMPMTMNEMLPAMLIVVVPAFLICTGITVLAWRATRAKRLDRE
jgi:hypothetical protein